MFTDIETKGQLKEFFQNKRVLVTGGFGFVGSHMVKKLVEYHSDVTVLDIDTSQERDSLLNDPAFGLREKTHIIQGDMVDFMFVRDMVEKGQYHLIYHFAAYPTVIEKAIEKPWDTIRVNTIALVDLLEAIRLAQYRCGMVLFSSTDKVYGEMEGDAYREACTPLRGVGIYDSSKLAADVFAQSYREVFGLPAIVLRMCNLFGPYDFNIEFRLVPKAMKNIYGEDTPQPPELYFDSIDHWRDYLYIDDAIRAMLLLAYDPHCRGKVYNLLACHYSSTPDMLKTIVEETVEIEQQFDHGRAEAILNNGIAIKVRAGNHKVISIKKQHLEGKKIKEDVGFEPNVAFVDGLRETIKFYRDYFLNKRGKSVHSQMDCQTKV